jgi:dethiobiotin synthetase
LDDEGGTLADLAVLLRKVLPRNSGASQATVAAGDGLERGVGVVLVTGVELGTLNVTELTVEALRARGIAILGLVVGRWPARPGTVERGNLADLPRLTDVRLLGWIPEGPALPVAIDTGVP